jgi:hypothetical protein
MANTLGKLRAESVTNLVEQLSVTQQAGGGETEAVAVKPAGDDADSALPDPTRYAQGSLAALLVIAAILAVVLNALDLTTKEFKPSDTTTANFGLFAAFYVGAQVIERVLQLVSPLLPPWKMPDTLSPTEKAAQVKADRADIALGLAAVLGVAMSAGFGLFFLKAIGMHTTTTIDILLTGIVIAAGTKPLHDFIGYLQGQTAPKTKTTTP